MVRRDRVFPRGSGTPYERMIRSRFLGSLASPHPRECPPVHIHFNTLIAYWISSRNPKGSIGYGVTAVDLPDALWIIRRLGYEIEPATDIASIQVISALDELEEAHVRANMGPIVVRGLWYPFIGVGIPQWAYERRARTRIESSDR